MLLERIVENSDSRHLSAILGWFCMWWLYIWQLVRGGENKLKLTLVFAGVFAVLAFILLHRWNFIGSEKQEITIAAAWFTPIFIVIVFVLAFISHKRHGYVPEYVPEEKEVPSWGSKPESKQKKRK